MINISSDSHISSNARSDGFDILFTDSGGSTKIPYERELYTTGTGALVAWVKVSSLSSSVDTVIYMYYGNASASDQQDATNVWDSSFQGVWHLKEDPTSTCTGTKEVCDSTVNDNDTDMTGTMTSGDLVVGQIGNGLDFDGADDALNAGTVASLDYPSSMNTMTVSAWIYARTTGENSQGRIVGKASGTSLPSNGWYFIAGGDSSNGLKFASDYDSSHLERPSGTNVISLSAWQYVTMTWDGSSTATNAHIYKNGTEVSYATSANGVTTRADDSGQNLTIGNNPAASRTFDGIIDELHVSNTVRSTGWITTEYNNQSSPSTFYSIADFETEGGGGGGNTTLGSKVRGGGATIPPVKARGGVEFR